MVVATTFASNVARLQTLANAAEAAGRSVCLLGRAMRRMTETAIATGLLTQFPKTVSPEEASQIPRENLLLLVTGSQGERRAAASQLASQGYMGISLKEGDTFLFSSRTIPGNERPVARIMNQLSEKGVDVLDDEGGRYHVSGHANRPDLETFHDLVKPQFLIPMHGEHRHLREHAKLGEAKGLRSMIVTNGMMIDLSGNAPKVAEYVDAGRQYLDGNVLIGDMDGVVRDRMRMALNGHVVVTLIVDEADEPLGEPWCEVMGLPQRGRSDADLVEVLEADLSQFVGRADRRTIRDDEKLEKELIRIVRQSAQADGGQEARGDGVVCRAGLTAPGGVRLAAGAHCRALYSAPPRHDGDGRAPSGAGVPSAPRHRAQPGRAPATAGPAGESRGRRCHGDGASRASPPSRPRAPWARPGSTGRRDGAAAARP
jgi:ribonuclease J